LKPKKEEPKVEVKKEESKPKEQPKVEVKKEEPKPKEQPKVEAKKEEPKPKAKEQPKAKKGAKPQPKAKEQPKPKEESKKVEETKDTPKTVEIEDGSDDDDLPPLEEVKQTTGESTDGQPDPKAAPKQSRSEKKSRKAMSKLGMKPVEGISRVVLKKSKTMLIVIAKPDVYKSPTTDTYIVFGEAKPEDLSQQGLNEAAKNLNKTPEGNPSVVEEEEDDEDAPPPLVQDEAPKKGPTPTTTSSEEKVDETGVEEKDIELVMSQAQVSRSAAVKALKKTKNDIVNAIMELSNEKK